MSNLRGRFILVTLHREIDGGDLFHVIDRHATSRRDRVVETFDTKDDAVAFIDDLTRDRVSWGTMEEFN